MGGMLCICAVNDGQLRLCVGHSGVSSTLITSVAEGEDVNNSFLLGISSLLYVQVKEAGCT